MATSRKQDDDFIEDVISNSLLDDSILWIARNMSPEDVFDKDDLGEWAKNNGYKEEE
ncbi:hypothetical protein LCGC14_1413380 [marine sediment metagenome]|uniref:Uncharacterized protein n=1 Tax=marine sediment metagenome TaxID=412755 RepID=A0A0F9KEN3_9ZZZZ